MSNFSVLMRLGCDVVCVCVYCVYIYIYIYIDGWMDGSLISLINQQAKLLLIYIA